MTDEFLPEVADRLAGLAVVEHELAEAEAGRFRIEPLLFHLAGIPSYLVVGELFAYARANHASQGRLTQCAGLLAQACSHAAHAVLAARGEWVTNEKTLLARAGLQAVDELLAAARPDDLLTTVEAVHHLCSAAVHCARSGF